MPIAANYRLGIYANIPGLNIPLHNVFKSAKERMTYIPEESKVIYQSKDDKIENGPRDRFIRVPLILSYSLGNSPRAVLEIPGSLTSRSFHFSLTRETHNIMGPLFIDIQPGRHMLHSSKRDFLYI
jgi:hypothetical protein